MNKDELKSLLLNSLDADRDNSDIHESLEKEGLTFEFSKNFEAKVFGRLFSDGKMSKQVEFINSMNFAFYRIALSGVAAIVILLISILLKEGSFSFNALLGLNDSFDESIVYLLTGN
jgi:hypothetical protein